MDDIIEKYVEATDNVLADINIQFPWFASHSEIENVYSGCNPKAISGTLALLGRHDLVSRLNEVSLATFSNDTWDYKTGKSPVYDPACIPDFLCTYTLEERMIMVRAMEPSLLGLATDVISDYYYDTMIFRGYRGSPGWNTFSHMLMLKNAFSTDVVATLETLSKRHEKNLIAGNQLRCDIRKASDNINRYRYDPIKLDEERNKLHALYESTTDVHLVQEECCAEKHRLEPLVLKDIASVMIKNYMDKVK